MSSSESAEIAATEGSGRPRPPRAASVRNRLFHFGASLLALLLVLATYRSLDPGSALALLTRIGPWAGLLLVPLAAATLLDALAWRALLGALRHGVGLSSLLLVRAAAEAVHLAVLGGWALADGLGPYLLHRRDRVPLARGVASVALRKALLFLAQSVYLGTGVAVGWGFYQRISPATLGHGGFPVLMALAAVLVGVAAVVTVGAVLSGRLASSAQRLALVLPGALRRAAVRSGERASHLDAALRGSRHFSTLSVPFGLYVLLWVVEGTETLLLLILLGAPVRVTEVWAFEPAVVILRNLAFFLPAGLGVQELGYFAFFQAAGYPDPAPLSAAFSVLKRLREAIWIGFGLVALTLLGGRAPADAALSLEPNSCP